MHIDVISLIVWGSVAIFLLAISETLRGIVKWVFLKLTPSVLQHPLAMLKTLLHEVAMAHKAVFYNLQPRKRVYYELSRTRTTVRIDRD